MSDFRDYLTDATMITTVVPAGRADFPTTCSRPRGTSAPAAASCTRRAAPVRANCLACLASWMKAEREVSQYRRPSGLPGTGDQRDLPPGGLGKPGGGYLYLTALEKVATYIPEASMARLQAGD